MSGSSGGPLPSPSVHSPSLTSLPPSTTRYLLYQTSYLFPRGQQSTYNTSEIQFLWTLLDFLGFLDDLVEFVEIFQRHLTGTSLDRLGLSWIWFPPQEIDNLVAEAHRLLVEAHDETALNKRTCREWFQKLKNGDFDVDDKGHSGRPKIYEDAELEELLEEDSSLTQKELASRIASDQLGVVYYELLNASETTTETLY
ncbi:Mariner Mos1 transposase [Eumeta japonica]|uniref:Mariner Mos1 transposase n=1 Tax=Eumeta variegata TaxID=151549 RepID=A0A4C1U2C2_EUMVA|nr:Mariner Mos1 transposase [Eumeta japonica]